MEQAYWNKIKRKNEDTLKMSGMVLIFEDGYGQISRLVMRDQELQKTSKLLYAYLCSLGAGSSPNRKEICFDLKIGKTTLSNAIKELKEKKFISVEKQRNSNGTFYHNLYTIKSIIEDHN